MQVLDRNGVEITAGKRVSDGVDYGYVFEVTDPDGDVDSYGRAVGIPPRVRVTFDDGVEDWYSTCVHSRGWIDYMCDSPYVCDEVHVV
jgi:hypothetical protein